MTRHLYFGNNLNIRIGSVLHDLLNLTLGIKTFVSDTIMLLRFSLVQDCARTFTPDLSELGVFLNLDAPPLVINEVPVEGVHLHAGHGC